MSLVVSPGAVGCLERLVIEIHLHLFSSNMWENRKQIRMTVEQDNKVLKIRWQLP